ncbi:Cytoplasmic protein [Salmonella enterica subsp. enterica serovar Newport str. USMARC-S3124.1]|nr:Cytoplasmic protein [Salmonella enterica subsp. enterica serovar Newport str. USMARC-S3124.1]
MFCPLIHPESDSRYPAPKRHDNIHKAFYRIHAYREGKQMNKRFNIDWDNELTQEQLINLILTDEDLPKLRSLTIVIGRHNTPAIADFLATLSLSQRE